jgi:hypothetical protein
MLGTSARLAILVVLTTAPLRAQIGLASGTVSVSLTATRMPSIGVSLPGGTAAMIPASDVFTQPISDTNAKGRRTDGMQVRIGLSGWHQPPAGTYRGTLNLLAITA